MLLLIILCVISAFVFKKPIEHFQLSSKEVEQVAAEHDKAVKNNEETKNAHAETLQNFKKLDAQATKLEDDIKKYQGEPTEWTYTQAEKMDKDSMQNNINACNNDVNKLKTLITALKNEKQEKDKRLQLLKDTYTGLLKQTDNFINDARTEVKRTTDIKNFEIPTLERDTNNLRASFNACLRKENRNNF